MTDTELILWVLAVIYAAECGYWVRPGSLLFLSQFGDRCRLRVLATAALLRNDHGGLLFGNLLPWGHSLLAQTWPLSLSPQGVASWAPQVITADGRADEPDRFVRWEDVRSVAHDGRHITINDQPFVAALSTDQARQLRKLVNRLRQLPTADERETAIVAAVEQWLNETEFDQRYQQHQWRSLPLRCVCVLLMAYVFVVAPSLLFWHVSQDFLGVLPGYFGLLALTMLTYMIVHSWLGRDSRERWGHLAMMIVSPADAMHACDSLFRNLAISFHPLVVARVLASVEAYRELARDILLDLRFPLPRSHGPRPATLIDTEHWFRRELGSALEECMRRGGLDVAELVRSPQPEDAESRSYCPRCRGQYVLTEGRCSTCTLVLVPLDGEAPTAWVARPPRIAKVETVAAPVPAPAPPVEDPPRKDPPKQHVTATRPTKKRDKGKKHRGRSN